MESTSEATDLNVEDEDKPSMKVVWGKRILTAAFLILVPVLLFNIIKNIEWNEVKEALNDYELRTLFLGAGITLISYITFASYDLLGKIYTKHSLPYRQILPLGFVCYAFNLNLTAWVGGIALRYRLYSRLGLKAETITKIFSLNLITNWLGYFILAGSIFSLRLLHMPDEWKIGTTALQFVGFFMLALAAGYLVACQFSKHRSFHIKKYEITLPSLSLGLSQAGLAMANWSLMGLLIFIFLPADQVSYPTVLGLLLIGAIAGVVTHIPAGLGVLETVFITMLQHELSKSTILAALISYRIIYFLIPLAIAAIGYIIMESRAKKMAANNNQEEPEKVN